MKYLIALLVVAFAVTVAAKDRVETVKIIKADTVVTTKIDTIKTITFDTLTVTKKFKDTTFLVSEDTAKVVKPKAAPAKK